MSVAKRPHYSLNFDTQSGFNQIIAWLETKSGNWSEINQIRKSRRTVHRLHESGRPKFSPGNIPEEIVQSGHIILQNFLYVQYIVSRYVHHSVRFRDFARRLRWRGLATYDRLVTCPTLSRKGPGPGRHLRTLMDAHWMAYLSQHMYFNRFTSVLHFPFVRPL